MLLLLSLIATWYMAGLCWFVQAIAYPQFARVSVADFSAYHAAHLRATGYVVLPAMVVELATAVALVWHWPGDRVYQVALALVFIIWVNTFAMAVPLHRRLTNGHDAAVIRRLVRVNWVRSIAWTARGVLLLWAAADR